MLQESLSTDPLLPRSPSGGSLASPIPPPSLYTDHVLPLNPASLHSAASAARCAIAATRATNDPSVFTITEKAPTRALSWLKALAFSHLRHYKDTMLNRHLNTVTQ